MFQKVAKHDLCAQTAKKYAQKCIKIEIMYKYELRVCNIESAGSRQAYEGGRKKQEIKSKKIFIFNLLQ